MAGNLVKLPIFTEEDPKTENPIRFLRQIEYSFAPVALQYTSEELHLDTAKAFYLGSVTSKTAQT